MKIWWRKKLDKESEKHAAIIVLRDNEGKGLPFSIFGQRDVSIVLQVEKIPETLAAEMAQLFISTRLISFPV